jgi:very-short-patch-repair endonuclease
LASTAAEVQYDQQKIRAQLRKWQEHLLDLTKSNPLLGINRSRVSKLRITDPQARELFEALVVDEAELKLPLATRRNAKTQPQLELDEADAQANYQIEPGEVEFEATPIELMRRLRRIYDNARTSVEERGVTTLHVGFGTLVWNDAWLGESISPLWMLPAQLVSKGPNVALRLLASDEEMRLNPALELYLRERHKIKLPEMPDEPTSDTLLEFLRNVELATQEHRWRVTDDLWLTTFSFESLVIYEDLNAMADAAVGHPVIAALARAMEIGGAPEQTPDELDELATPDVVPIPILPVDSSQLHALTSSAAGNHQVVHGPPGTGKSQTISNLIADALGRNKTVLFVSSKMAALNVVYRRLAEEGLGRFCLEAHSTKAGKAKIVDELRRTLATEDTRDSGRLDAQVESLLRARRELNRYVQELHRIQEPLGRSIYQAIGRVETLASVPEVRGKLPWADALTATPSELEDRVDALGRLGAHSQVFDNREYHPWRGFTDTTLGVREREGLESSLRLVLAYTQQFQCTLPGFSSLVAENDQLSLSDLEQLRTPLLSASELDRMPSSWHTSTAEEMGGRAELFETAARQLVEFGQKVPTYASVLALPFEDGRNLLERGVTTYPNWYTRISPRYWQWRAEVRKAAKPAVRLNHAALVQLYSTVQRLLEIDQWLNSHQEDLANETGPSAVRDSAKVILAAKRFRVAAAVLDALKAIGKTAAGTAGNVTEQFRQAVSAVCTTLPSCVPEFSGALNSLDGHWPNGLVDGSQSRNVPLSLLNARISELLSALDRIQEWTILNRLLQKCASLGLMPFLDALDLVTAKVAREAFERRFYTIWVSTAIARSDVLSTFNAGERQELVAKFKLLDGGVRKASSSRIQAVAAESARRIQHAQTNVGAGSEVSILRRELQKRKKIKPLRKLFAEIPHALQALKPCMLMSPISVSTYLKPGSAIFDLVVFDEASQMPTPEAVASILRAKQVVVAGDRNQLPPTSFFRAAVEIEDDDREQTDQTPEGPLESLLDDCVAIVPFFRETSLKWHYRSRDERLIKFSNSLFYDNRLITFPSACTSGDGRGVQLSYVSDGVWDRGRSRVNRREAHHAAQTVIEHFTKYPSRSLGVVAMNAQQREAIEDAVSEAVRDRPDILPLMDPTRPEPYFVKSLENVQGDERDTMIISVGYGKDPDGHPSLNFGPINQEGGWRRLNVLVTRAKWQIVLITSMRSHELSGVNPNNRGAVALRDFIAYAERRCELPQPAAAPTFDETNNFEDGVAAVLRDRGLLVDQQVGASKFRIDLAIRDHRDPSRYVLGVECDGATYHGSRTARDRDLLRQQVLEGMGWRIHRVWSTEWFNDRNRAIEAILASLQQAEERPLEESIQAIPLPQPPVEPVVPSEIALAEQLSPPPSRRYLGGVPYRKYQEAADRDLLIQPRRKAELAATVTAIVEIEGPIHEDLLCVRLKEICGVDRTGSNIQSNMTDAIYLAIRDRSIERRQQDFLWRPGQSIARFRLGDDHFERPLQWIHRDEIALALLFLVEDQFGMSRSDFPRAIGRLFGLFRVPANVADYISDVVNALVDRGTLREDGDRISLPD